MGYPGMMRVDGRSAGSAEPRKRSLALNYVLCTPGSEFEQPGAVPNGDRRRSVGLPGRDLEVRETTSLTNRPSLRHRFAQRGGPQEGGREVVGAGVRRTGRQKREHGRRLEQGEEYPTVNSGCLTGVSFASGHDDNSICRDTQSEVPIVRDLGNQRREIGHPASATVHTALASFRCSSPGWKTEPCTVMTCPDA